MVNRLFCAVALCGMVLSSTATFAQEKPAKSKFETLIEGKKKVSGMWTLYYDDQKMYAEISSTALKKDFIVATSIAKGISRGNVLGGYSWGFGDDAILGFRKSGDKLFILQRNVRFRAKAKSPEADAVKLAYNDSVLYALPVLTTSPSGGTVVDITRVFMNDEQGIGSAIGSGFRLMMDRTTWGTIKAFPQNVELRVNAVYSGSRSIETVPNSKGVQVGIHYSVSELPAVGSNGYKPRAADDRIGYFLTAIKDFSDKEDPDQFVRYINRWNLQKLDSSIAVSPPKEPIKFYMEKTVPVYLRPTVEAGIMEWNKAFEKLGFSGAIKVDIQPDDADFDPENIHYNTFRWITAEAGFAMGPSRVDPRTGQILDADIIFDASFLKSWSNRWEAFRPEEIKALSAKQSPFLNPQTGQMLGHQHSDICTLCNEMQRQMGFAAASLMAQGVAMDGKLPKDLVHEGMKEVVMHEVGHTLGLRHNFKASTWKTLEEINDKEAGLKEGTVASVMDYTPVNLAVDPNEQGLYYTQTVGPYDIWAIEYGYKVIKSGEAEELKKIASRSGEPALEYSTDEDTRGIDPDPLSNRFDLGKDPLVFVRRQIEHTSAMIPKVVENTVHDGDGYQRSRQAFGLLFSEYWRAISFAARYPGGLYVHRDHKGDKGALPPFKIVEAEKQREAMKLVAESAFAPPKLEGSQFNYMAASRWNHWGTSSLIRLDYPIHDMMLNMQDMVLSDVLYSTTLERILDNEFKAADGEDVYTLAEHMDLISNSIFSEWQKPEAKDYSNTDPLIDSFRRNFQRSALRRLSQLVTNGLGAPEDARALTRMHLVKLRDHANKLLGNKKLKLDDYSRAHLMDCVSQIDKTLEYEIAVPFVN